MTRQAITAGRQFLCVLLFLFPFSLQAQVFVTPSGAGAMNGSSWGNAYPATQLRAALRAATAGTQFWLAAGTYKPDAFSRDSFFSINSGVKVYGGFNGTETQLSQRNWTNNVTILSGDIGVPGDSTDNSYHVVKMWYVDNTTLLDGLTVTGANTTADYGGGIYNVTTNVSPGSYPTLRHCTISHNRAAYGGAGIYNYSFSPAPITMTIDSCLFEYNICDSDGVTHRGGGAIFSDAELTTTTTNIINSTFQYNSSNYYGGAIEMRCASGTTQGTIKNCTFQYNSTGTGGGAVNFTTFNDYGQYGHFNVNVDSCTFYKNNSYFGGAIYCGFGRVWAPTLTISHSLFDQNTAANAAGVFENLNSSDIPYGEVGKISYQNDVFRKNTVGIGDISAIDVDVTAMAVDTTYIVNCLFDRDFAAVIGNRTSEDGLSLISVLNSTIYADSTTATSAYHAGVIYNYADINGGYDSTSSVVLFRNSILYWPTTLIFTPPAIYNWVTNSHTYISHSLLRHCNGSGPGWNAQLGTDEGGNIDVYPKFSDTANANFNLGCGSPCINAGSNAYIYPDTSLGDLNGNTRIYSGIVDIGAYEHNSVAPQISFTVTQYGDSVFVQNTSVGPIDSLTWDFGDGTHAHSNTAGHLYPDSATYVICLHIYSCAGNDDSCITINQDAAGVNTIAGGRKCMIAPNPANDQIAITALQGSALVELCDMAGRVLYKETVKDQLLLNTGNLAEGIYLVRVTRVQTGMCEIQKVVIKH